MKLQEGDICKVENASGKEQLIRRLVECWTDTAHKPFALRTDAPQ